jgi:hypothetical protein
MMNTKLFLLCFLSAATALAADPPTQYNATALPPIPLVDAARLQKLLTEKHDSPLITLGKSDFVISGPLIEGLRPLPPVKNLRLGQKILRLPIIRLFVPTVMESPPGTGKYFAWRNVDDNLPWEARSSRPGIQKGPF